MGDNIQWDTQLDPVNVTDIKFCDEGRSLALELVDTIPPHARAEIVFRNCLCINISQGKNDGYPLLMCECNWRELAPEQAPEAARRLMYGFADGIREQSEGRLILVHFEGDLVGDLLVRGVEYAVDK